MSRQRDFSDFPERVGAGAGRGWYVRARGRYAVHHAEGEQDASGAEMTFAREGIAVHRGEPGETRGATLTPVYRLQPDGPLSVPTGKIFLRFKEGVEAASRRAEIERAGYEIIESPPYAPSGAWVRAADGDVALSLSQIEALEKLADVKNVEPQMLVERAQR